MADDIQRQCQKLSQLTRCAIIAIGLFAPFSQRAFGDGTKQLFSDAGLYSGDPAGSVTMDIYTWAATSLSLNGQTSVTNAPEGRYVARATVPTHWGGFGIFNVIPGMPGSTTATDYSDYAGGAIRFWLNSQTELEVQIQYNAQDGTTDQKVTQVIGTTGGVWREIVIPLTNFPSYPNYPDGLYLAQIVGPFLIGTSDASGATLSSKTWMIDDVRWTKPIASLAVYPWTAILNPGQHRQFTVEGVSSNGEPVLIYANLTAPANVGSLTPTGSTLVPSSVLLGGLTNGTISIVASNPPSNVFTTAAVAITRANLQQEFGVVSSTRTNLHLDFDSKLLTFYGGSGAAAPLLTNQPLGLVSGEPILQTTVNLTATTDYAGWFVQSGKNAGTTNTVDMSAYYDGNLRFYFNGPPALKGTMTIGMRSGNVSAGSEESAVSLDTYTTFDGQWHQVAIPIAAFAGSRPKADLSRIQDFFTITVTGNVGVQTFSIEDVRWDTGITTADGNLRISSITQAGSNFNLTVTGPPGLAIAIQSSTNLKAWTTLNSGVLGAEPYEFMHTNAIAAQTFYRIVASP